MKITKEMLRDIQKIQLEIALELKRICEKHKISFFLDSGTLLGAIRHGGFIPWDDDFDVGLLRKEYNRLLQVLPNELEDKYEIQTWENDPGYPGAYIKIRKKDTIFREYKTDDLQRMNGIFIDIFPYDYLPNDEKKIKKIGRRVTICKCLLRAKSHFKVWENPDKFDLKKYVMYLPIRLVSVFISKKKMIHCYDKLVQKCNSYVDEAKLVFPQGSAKFGKWNLPRECVETLMDIEFEGHLFKCSKDYEVYLRTVYGDYMKLPPIEEREKGHEIVEVKY